MLHSTVIKSSTVVHVQRRQSGRCYAWKNVSTVRGRGIRKPQWPVPALCTIHVDHSLKDLHKKVRIFADVFFVNGIPFLLTMSENIVTVFSALLPNRKKETMKLFLEKFFYFVKRMVSRFNNWTQMQNLDASKMNS